MSITLDPDELKKVAEEAIKERLVSALNYGNLSTLVNEVFEENRDDIKELVSEALSNVFKDQKSRKVIVEEFERKVAKTLVGKLEGSVEKAVEAYRADPTLKAKVILAVETLVKEHNEKAA